MLNSDDLNKYINALLNKSEEAYLINKAKDINVINYKDDSNRTIGLDECVEKVFTSTTDKTKTNIIIT